MAGTEQPPQPEDEDPEDEFTDVFHFNVGGWLFSISKATLAQFHDSILWRQTCTFSQSDTTRIFIDRDGFVFRHVHHFLLTSQLPLSSLSDLNLLNEQATGFQLQPMIEALDTLKKGEPYLCEPTGPEIPVTERASINYWKTQKCNSRLSEFPVKSLLFPGIQYKAHLGLLETPLLDSEEEVYYYFFPIYVLEEYPVLVTDDNLLWFSESFALLECGCDEFRFIGNFLRTGKFLLPEKFSKFEELEAEMKSLGIPCVIQTLRNGKKPEGNDGCSKAKGPVAPCSSNSMTGNKLKHFYIMSLELLAKYPDSALGQLSIESSVDGSKLYITGTGTLFQHISNWLGTCRLPLTSSLLEIYGLCTYLDKGDITHQPMREAVRSYLKCRTGIGPSTLCDNWTADVQEFPKHQIVRVYVGNHWYATYLKTLLKYPELLSNSRKTCWITCGFSLLVNGDGEMFRHILNFLRLGSLFLPSDFQEWSLFCQEVNEFKIPSLVEALHECKAYRLWVEEHVPATCPEDPKHQGKTWKLAGKWIVLEDGDRPENERKRKDTTFSTATAGSKGVNHKTTIPALNLSNFDCKSPHSNKVLRKNEAVENDTEHTASPILKVISLVKKLHETSTKNSVCDQHHRLNNASPALSGRDKLKPRSAIQERESPCALMSKKETQTHNAQWLVPNTPQPTPVHKGVMQMFIPAHKDTMRWLTVTHEDETQQAVVVQKERSPGHKTATKYKDLRMEDERALTEDCSWSAMERGGVGDLGAILWVHHHRLVADDGSSASFQDSIIYMAERDIPKPACHAATPNDLIFLSFNMCQEEIFYARKCHSFLTGVILDSIRQGDPKSSIWHVASLVSKLWAFQIPARQFVDDLLTQEFYRDEKSKRDRLLCWLELTLPYARKFSQCINKMLQRGCHQSALCSVLRMFLGQQQLSENISHFG